MSPDWHQVAVHHEDEGTVLILPWFDPTLTHKVPP